MNESSRKQKTSFSSHDAKAQTAMRRRSFSDDFHRVFEIGFLRFEAFLELVF